MVGGKFGDGSTEGKASEGMVGMDSPLQSRPPVPLERLTGQVPCETVGRTLAHLCEASWPALWAGARPPPPPGDLTEAWALLALANLPLSPLPQGLASLLTS